MSRPGRIGDFGPCADAELPAPIADGPLAEAVQAAPVRRGARRTLAEMTQRLRGLLRRKGQSSEDAEDLAQDALLKLELYQRAQDVRDPEAFLRRTAVNQAIDEARRTRRSPLSTSPLDAFDLVDPSPTPDDLFAANRSLERLTAGLQAMNTKSRDVLMAQRLDGLSYAQIAEQFGISQSAVEKRLARGMRFLQEWMEGW